MRQAARLRAARRKHLDVEQPDVEQHRVPNARELGEQCVEQHICEQHGEYMHRDVEPRLEYL